MKKKRRRLTDKIFGHLKIREQILLFMVILSLAGTLTIGLLAYGVSKRVLETNYQKTHEYNLQVSSNIIEIQLKAIMEQGRTLLTNDNFKMAFTTDRSTTAYFTSTNRLILERILSDMASMDTAISGIMVVNEQGNWNFFSKYNYQSGYMRHYYTTDSILAEDWVDAAKEAKGKEIFYGQNVLFDDERNDTFSMVKNLIDPDTSQSMGYMVMVLKKSLLDKAFGTRDEGFSTNRYMILDLGKDQDTAELQEKIVYFNGDTEDTEKILNQYLENDEKGDYLFSTYYNSISDWNIVNVIEKSELTSESSYIGGIMILACMVLLVLSFRVSSAISRRISRPLYVLEQTIQEVGEGNYKVEAEFDQGEIGRIGNQFKNMVNNNLELRERLLNTEIKEREAELLLLQSQINPHFLYNTLDSLYFMAVIHNADDIATMVMALSDTFKLSLNQGKKLIKVKDELQKIEAYMKIQDMRYHGRFELRIEVEDAMREDMMLSFILQPLVENAMYHGLEAKIGDGYIEIKGWKKDGQLHFSVSDNGVGMDDFDALEKGYGIRNIRERIKLMYGEEGQVIFESKKGEGTTVFLHLPVLSEV